MKIRFQVSGFRFQVPHRDRRTRLDFNLQPSTFNLCSGFTLTELLVVIAILGILAGLAVPALKNLGKSEANVSAARQLLDDVGRARQLALSQRTTVYMVFVPMNFWELTSGTSKSVVQQSGSRRANRRYQFVRPAIGGLHVHGQRRGGRPAGPACVALSRAVADAAGRNLHRAAKVSPAE